MFNIRIDYAHGITYSFISVSEADADGFKSWLKKEVHTDTMKQYTYWGTEHFLNREFVCAATIDPIK